MDNDRIQELMDECWDYGRGIVNSRKLAYAVIKECSQHLWENEIEWTAFKEDRLFEHFGIK